MSDQDPYQSPSSAPGTTALTNKPNLKEVLLGFTGRIPRRTYWLWAIVSGLVFYAIFIPVMLFTTPAETGSSSEPAGMSPVAAIVLLVLYVPMVWIGLALQIKRWHDRGKSGWWCLIGLIPIVGAIWAFVEVGCLRGTAGPNEYGEDPT